MKKTLQLILPALVLAIFAFTACLKAVPETPTPSPTPTPTTDSTIYLVKSKASDYVIVYSSSEQSSATQLVAAFKGIFTATLSKASSTSSATTYEILLGSTGRDESKNLLSLIGSNGYGIKVYENKLVIVGTDTDLTARALYYFQASVLKDKKYSSGGNCILPKTYSYIVKNPGPATFSEVMTKKMDYSVQTTLIGACPKQGNCYVSQGAASDGTNVFFVMRNSDDTEAVICKYTLSPFAFVAKGDVFNGGHCNDLTYDSINKRIVLAHGQTQGTTLTLISPQTLNPTGDVTIAKGSGAITFNASRGQFAISQGGSTLHFLTSSLTLLSSHSRTDGRSSTYVAQGMGCDDDYIYFPMSPSSGKSTDNVLVTYDWSAQYIGDIHIPLSMESESMFCVNGKYYVNFYSSSSAKLYQVMPVVTYKYYN